MFLRKMIPVRPIFQIKKPDLKRRCRMKQQSIYFSTQAAAGQVPRGCNPPIFNTSDPIH